MSAIFILISVSLVVASGFLIAFIRAVRNGQFDDSYTPSVRMLFDDELKSTRAKSTSPLEPEQKKTSSNV
jgi:cbb3-type cytochrome oxidase maturation protein